MIDGDLAYAKGFGVTDLERKTPPDADTVYRIGSISKSFTGLALISLRDDGAIRLDDSLAAWVPEAAGLVYPTRDAAPLTVRQLLSHTSGLPRMGTYEAEKAPDEAAMVKSLANLALESAPGERWSYSNLGFSLLGIVAGRAGKAPPHAVLPPRILTPLGMTATHWDHAQIPAGRLATGYEMTPKGPVAIKELARLGAGDGAGGIYSSVRDMARYLAMQLAAYPPRSAEDGGPIRRSSLREAHSTGVAVRLAGRLIADAGPGEPIFEVQAGGYGFGWNQSRGCDHEVVGHGGAIDSYRADLRFSPSRGVGIVLLSNFPNANTDPFAQRAFQELARTGALVERARTPRPEFEVAMKRFVAVYNQWDEAAFKALLDPKRAPLPEEQGELAGYKALHGTCTSFAPSEVRSSHEARYAVQCERGRLEVTLLLAAEGSGVDGFFGVSRGIPAPAALANTGAAVATLVAKWDERVYKAHLASARQPRAEIKAMFDGARGAHGSCKVREPVHDGLDWYFELACERGGGLELVVAPSVSLRPIRGKLCPVR